MKTFDLDKAIKDGCKTKCGYKARIVSVSEKDTNYPVSVAVKQEGDEETVLSYTRSGLFASGLYDELDLVNL